MINGDYILVKAPKDYVGKKYRGKYCYEHHLVYFQKYGIIPQKGEIIHHINGDKHDNRIENLILLSVDTHNKLHNKDNKYKLIKLKCPICERKFITERRKSLIAKHTKSQCCSRECSYKLDILRRTNQNKYLELIKDNIIEEFIGDKNLIGFI